MTVRILDRRDSDQHDSDRHHRERRPQQEPSDGDSGMPWWASLIISLLSSLLGAGSVVGYLMHTGVI